MEAFIISELRNAGLSVTSKTPLPLVTYPWKSSRTKNPVADIYVNGVYIQIASFMTVYNIAKYTWLASQDFPYYFMDCSDETWEPWVNSPCPIVPSSNVRSVLVQESIKQQLQEIKYFIDGKLDQVSALSKVRLNKHIVDRFDTFKEWGLDIPKIGV